MKRLVVASAVVLLAAVFLSCPRNHPPDAPSVPDGPSSGLIDSTYSFSASATDPEGDSVAFRFDWGDGRISPWSDPVPSGASVTASHAWFLPGEYAVRAQARDESGNTSNWSDQLGVWILAPEHAWRITGVVRPPGADYIARLTFLPGRDLLYLADENTNSLLVLSTSNHQVVATVPLRTGWGSDRDVVVSPDGNTAYVSTYADSNYIGIIRTSDHMVVDSFQLPGWYSTDLALSPNGERLYVNCVFDDSMPIYVVRTSDLSVIDSISFGNAIGGDYADMVIPPEGEYMYLTFEGEEVYVVRLADHEIVATLPECVGIGLALDPEGEMLYFGSWSAADTGCGYAVSTSTNAILDSVFVPYLPGRLAVSPDGEYLYVLCSVQYERGVLIVIALPELEVVWTVRLRHPGRRILAMPDEDRLYVTSGPEIYLVGR